ncbi:hypothetical protein AVEN_120402-1 [Araneus ventricosus]|uniref:Uncharacterized protein n=1 Tax=Araneus ventricosus TaxID=182803 RepID=A0A4Y2NNJ6_ARAVE|nr:hypothetical protein AVEN_120402-1 [Araneus ventricosus]
MFSHSDRVVGKNIITMIKHFVQKCSLNCALVRPEICIDPRVMAGYPEKAEEKMKKVLIVLSQNKHILEKDYDEILLLYADFLLNIVKPDSFEFTSFNPKSDSLDTFLQTCFNNNHYEKVWKIIKMLLKLSHGQGDFSVNKALEIENLKDASYISQRVNHEFIKLSGAIYDLKITKEMRTAATSIRAKYMQYLESERSKEKTETKSFRG